MHAHVSFRLTAVVLRGQDIISDFQGVTLCDEQKNHVHGDLPPGGLAHVFYQACLCECRSTPVSFHTLRLESRLHVRDACCSTHMCVWEALGARRFVVADIMEVLGLASTIQAGRLR